MQRNREPVQLAVIGGSGLYELADLDGVEELALRTPFGEPSDLIRIGRVAGRPVAFLARHGRRHGLLPGEINYRANIYALKQLGVERILSASAVGSLREEIRPRDVVVVDQFVDRTRKRASTFFGEGVAVHVSLADPTCPELRGLAGRVAGGVQARVHPGGTYVCIEGPAFSTRAESELFRSWGMHVIGMTNLPEARLAREAEICYATLALVTDYDCWHEEEEQVSVAGVLENLRANAGTAAALLRGILEAIPQRGAGCGCGQALAHAIITPLGAIPAVTAARLRPILGRYLASG
jgi:5'-methylthioadenosine phosphorylase